MHDLLIRNAMVFDGSGAQPAVADVAVRDGTVLGVGPNLPAHAGRVVDARGLAAHGQQLPTYVAINPA